MSAPAFHRTDEHHRRASGHIAKRYLHRASIGLLPTEMPQAVGVRLAEYPPVGLPRARALHGRPRCHVAIASEVKRRAHQHASHAHL